MATLVYTIHSLIYYGVWYLKRNTHFTDYNLITNEIMQLGFTKCLFHFVRDSLILSAHNFGGSFTLTYNVVNSIRKERNC